MALAQALNASLGKDRQLTAIRGKTMLLNLLFKLNEAQIEHRKRILLLAALTFAALC